MSARDTSPEATAIQTAIYRRMTPQRRADLAMEMSMSARAVTASGIRRRHPEYDDDQVRFALFRLLVGDALFRRAWPHAPILDP